MKQVDSRGSYLGMLSIVGQKKKQNFQYGIDKVAKRIRRWKVKLLSKGKKDVLIPIVAQTVPNLFDNLIFVASGYM